MSREPQGATGSHKSHRATGGRKLINDISPRNQHSARADTEGLCCCWPQQAPPSSLCAHPVGSLQPPPRERSVSAGTMHRKPFQCSRVEGYSDLTGLTGLFLLRQHLTRSLMLSSQGCYRPPHLLYRLIGVPVWNSHQSPVAVRMQVLLCLVFFLLGEVFSLSFLHSS